MQFFLVLNGIIDDLPTIIKEFQNKSKNDREGSQFAFVLFAPDNFKNLRTCWNNNKLWTYKTPKKTTTESDTRIHAERQLLNSCTFENCKGMNSNFKFILLYTWIIPCRDCASYILEKLKTFPETPVFVLYTTYGDEKDPELLNEMKENIKMLNDNGIRAERIKYRKPRVSHPQILPP